MPISVEDLRDLFSYLDRPNPPPCTHRLAEAVEFLTRRHLDVERIVPWLQQHGGYCDCEVIFNVYDKFGELVGWHLKSEDDADPK